MMLGISLILNIALVVVLGISVAYNVKWGILILKVQSTIEEALDNLDEQYGTIDEVLKIDLFFDSPEIRRVHTSVKNSRDTILSVALLLSTSLEVDNAENEKEE